MSRLMASLYCVPLLLGAALVGCSKTYDGDQRFPVSGKVTVDGQPVDVGVIAFYPKGGEKGKGHVTGAPIRDGTYSISEENGPTAASYQVQIHWNKKTGKKVPNPMDREQMTDELMEGLPAKYHEKSELAADVSAEKTTFDFDLQSN